jgi:hypothetical protein
MLERLLHRVMATVLRMRIRQLSRSVDILEKEIHAALGQDRRRFN